MARFKLQNISDFPLRFSPFQSPSKYLRFDNHGNPLLSNSVTLSFVTIYWNIPKELVGTKLKSRRKDFCSGLALQIEMIN
jgi:hypothetical protein